jgi:hypothetical protein
MQIDFPVCVSLSRLLFAAAVKLWAAEKASARRCVSGASAAQPPPRKNTRKAGLKNNEKLSEGMIYKIAAYYSMPA